MKMIVLVFIGLYGAWNLAVAAGAVWKKKQAALRMGGFWIRLIFGLGILSFILWPPTA